MKQNKKFYERPHIRVVELKLRQTLLVGSGNIEDFQNGGDVFTDPNYGG